MCGVVAGAASELLLTEAGPLPVLVPRLWAVAAGRWNVQVVSLPFAFFFS